MNSFQRRDFFKYMTILGLVSFGATTAQAKKLSQEKTKYQTSPKYGKKCSDCLHFIDGKNQCKLVKGDIDPNGWCNVFVQDPNK
jgi:hypothetical protein